MDGTRRPAGELAYAAHIPAQSATAHLSRLVDGGLLAVEAQGRHRYFRLSSPDIADTVETLAPLDIAVTPRVPRSPLPSKATPVEFIYSRTCYDHLAGEIAVKMLAAIVEARWLTADGRDFQVTRLGGKKLSDLGIDVDDVRRSRRAFARACVDLTQRRPHLGGALGVALLGACIARGWILRSRHSRVVSVTPAGEEALSNLGSA